VAWRPRLLTRLHLSTHADTAACWACSTGFLRQWEVVGRRAKDEKVAWIHAGLPHVGIPYLHVRLMIRPYPPLLRAADDSGSAPGSLVATPGLRRCLCNVGTAAREHLDSSYKTALPFCHIPTSVILYYF
jgi:hypothetical protein